MPMLANWRQCSITSSTMIGGWGLESGCGLQIGSAARKCVQIGHLFDAEARVAIDDTGDQGA